MILLNKIKLFNFLSHGKTEIEFKPNQKILIDGKSGSGKSSIVEGLIWALYGKGRSDNRSLIKKGTKKASVEVYFTDDDISYRVTRNITTSNKHDLNVSKLENKKYVPIKTVGVKDTQLCLEKKILSSSYLLFINSIVHPQDNADNFVKQTASRRKDIILEIINAEDYDTYLKKAKEELQKIRVVSEVLLSTISGKENIIQSNKEEADKLNEYEEENRTIKEKISKIEEELESLEEKKSGYEKIKMVIEVKEKEIKDIKTKTDNNEEQISIIQEKMNVIKETDVEVLKEKVKELDNLKIELKVLEEKKDEFIKWNEAMMKLISLKPSDRDFESEVKAMNAKIMHTMDEDVMECPELHKICPVLEEKRTERVKVLEKDLMALKEGASTHKTRNKEYSDGVIALGERPIISNNEIDALYSKISDLETFKEQLIEYESKKDTLKDLNTNSGNLKIENAQLVSNQLELTEEISKQSKILVTILPDIEKRIPELKESKTILAIKHDTILGNVSVARVAKKTIKAAEAEIVELREKSDKEVKNIEALELVKEAFNPNGIKSIVIDYVVPQLEDKINNVLAKLSDFRIKLETQRAGLGKDTMLEGLFITILNDQGEEFDFENYSGGEKVKIIVAISEALAEIQKMGFRILDELFIGLDEETIEKFVDVMIVLQERFSQLVCISHLKNIKDIFNERMMVTRINGTSQVN